MRDRHAESLHGPPVHRRPSQLSRRRKLLFSLLTFALAYVLVEFVAWVLLFGHGGMSYAAGRVQQTAGHETNPAEIDTRFEVVHPYLGYVMHIENGDYHVQGERPFSVTDHGFYDDRPPIRRRSPDKVLVAITGGSVAHQFAVLSSDTLAQALQRRFPDRKIEFVRLALNGFKQPQQLMSLSYVLALGGELDLVINIDGFNEIALPSEENIRYDVFSAFPRSWHLRVVTGSDLPLMRAIGLSEFCRQQQRTLAKRFRPLSWSPAALLVWNYLNSRNEAQILAAQQQVAEMRSLEQGFCAQGPSEDFASEQEMYARLAEIWADCSLQMHRLCEANTIEYWHFLQPTRQFPELDPSGFRWPGDPIPDSVQTGYPLLQRHGRRLREHGVEFHDLTGIFESFEGPVYVDFCHFSKAPNDVMAETIGRKIAERTARNAR